MTALKYLQDIVINLQVNVSALHHMLITWLFGLNILREIHSLIAVAIHTEANNLFWQFQFYSGSFSKQSKKTVNLLTRDFNVLLLKCIVTYGSDSDNGFERRKEIKTYVPPPQDDLTNGLLLSLAFLFMRRSRSRSQQIV